MHPRYFFSLTLAISLLSGMTKLQCMQSHESQKNTDYHSHNTSTNSTLSIIQNTNLTHQVILAQKIAEADYKLESYTIPRTITACATLASGTGTLYKKYYQKNITAKILALTTVGFGCISGYLWLDYQKVSKHREYLAKKFEYYKHEFKAN